MQNSDDTSAPDDGVENSGADTNLVETKTIGKKQRSVGNTDQNPDKV